MITYNKKDIPEHLQQYFEPAELGLEKTPEEYVDKMVEIFREVKRVMKKDGTLWLNLGDSYAGNCSRTSSGRQGMGDPREGIYTKTGTGLKQKDLVGIPWRVAFAMQADGWWLRQDIIEEVQVYCPHCGWQLEERIWRHGQDREIIWHKPNPMPESVTDRCTKSHEYIFLLSKSAKYYYDNDAIKYPLKESSIVRNQTGWNGNKKRDWPGLAQNNFDKYLGSESAKTATMANKRSVWTVNTKPFSEAHFATYPEELIDPCIKAGCPQDGIVIDPFMGSGTTCLVAAKQKKKSIGIELSEEYIKIGIDKRIEPYRTGLDPVEIESGQGLLFE